jgi:hypothetical protein
MKTNNTGDTYIVYNPIGLLDLKGDVFKTGISMKSCHLQIMTIMTGFTENCRQCHPNSPWHIFIVMSQVKGSTEKKQIGCLETYLLLRQVGHCFAVGTQ